MEGWTVKIVFLHFFLHLSLLHLPSSHLHLYLFVPLYLLTEITHPEKPPTLRKESIMKLVSCLNSTVSPHNKEPLVFLLIEPGSGSSSTCGLDCLFQSLIDYRQFPFNYDILTANFDCSERRERCRNYTR